MLALIEARLIATNDFTAVAVAESLEAVAAEVSTAETGTVFVVPFRERGRPQRAAVGAYRQTIDVQFATVLVSRQHDDPRGSERAKAFDTLKGQMESALVGWQYQPDSDVVSLAASETQGLGNGVSILTQTWQTTRFLTGGSA